MKTLYVSDLDGTLFNSRKEFTPYTRDILNSYIRSGGLFTIATARTAYGCDYRLEGVEFPVPAILMNGVFLYTFKTKQYVDARIMPPESIREIEIALERHHASGFLFTFRENNLSIFYTNPEDLQFTQYYSERARESCAEISRTATLQEAAEGRDSVYFAMTGEQETVEPIYRDLERIPGINAVIYLNVYNELYCLEVFDQQANKSNALVKLKEIVKPDEVVVFGDNHNDLGMMKIADRSYAPENAIPEAKQIADQVIGSCDQDGVARFIEQAHGL